MFLLLCVFALFLVQIAADEPCRTPRGQPGICTPVTSCPELLDAFANPRSEADVRFLRGYICERKTTRHERMTVCCGTSDDFTVFNKGNTPSQSVKTNLTRLSDTRYCGLQHKDDYLTIEANDAIGIDEFPWVAAIIAEKDNKSYTICSGALINARYVLTSAFCSFFFRAGIGKGVRLGEFYRTNYTDCINLPDLDAQDCSDYEDFDIEELIPHPFFDDWNGIHDILLLRLARRVTYSDYIRPICLPIPGRTFASLNDTMFTSGFIAGYENFTLEAEDYISPFKTKGAVTLVENDVCDEFPDFATNNVVYSNSMCTVHILNKSICLDNQGSPLMFSHKYQWHIEGILSHGFCSSKSETYTKVSKYLEWIQANLRP